MQSSSSERVLVGQRLAFCNSPVRSIQKNGNQRVIIFENGMRQVLQKHQLNAVVQQNIAQKQHLEAIRGMHARGDGKIVVKLGGKMKGIKKAYSSFKNAIAATNKKYSLAQPAKASRFHSTLRRAANH